MGNCCAQGNLSSESIRGHQDLYKSCICESFSTAVSFPGFRHAGSGSCNGNRRRSRSRTISFDSIIEQLYSSDSRPKTDRKYKYVKLLTDENFINFYKDKDQCVKQPERCRRGNSDEKSEDGSPRPLLNLSDDTYHCYKHINEVSSTRNHRRRNVENGPNTKCEYVAPMEVEDFVTMRPPEKTCNAPYSDDFADQESVLKLVYREEYGAGNKIKGVADIFKNPVFNLEHVDGKCMHGGGQCPLSSLLEKLVQHAVLSHVIVGDVDCDDPTKTPKEPTVFIDGDAYPLGKVVFIPKLTPMSGDYLATKCTLDTRESSRVLLISTDFLPTPRSFSKENSCSEEDSVTPRSIQSVPARKPNVQSNVSRLSSAPNLYYKPQAVPLASDGTILFMNKNPGWSSCSEEDQTLSKVVDISLDESDTAEHYKPCPNTFVHGKIENYLKSNIRSGQETTRDNEFSFLNKIGHAQSEAALNSARSKTIVRNSIENFLRQMESSKKTLSNDSSFLYLKRSNFRLYPSKETFLQVQSRKKRSMYVTVPKDVRET